LAVRIFSSTSGRRVENSGKSRWQCESINIAAYFSLP
jgi:hypothetical protein